MARIRFMNIEIDNLTMDEALLEIDRLIRTRSDAFVVTPNVDHIVQIEKGGVLGKIYQKADLILCDGKPLIWLSYWYGTPIKEKISGSDLFPAICRMAAVRGYRMYFLGAAEGVAAKAAENLTRKFPGLQVVGTYSPPYGFEKDTEEIQKIIRQIREARPQILIVGLGCPKQEKFIYDYRKDYNVPVSLGLGASLDFEAGRIQRAPRWMSDHGLEWIYRIFQDPRRLIKRYLIDDICIFRLAVKYKRKLRKKE
ncbi:MAG: WecB/TagA/CpsF family glycosyltransferase [Clostridiales bacterium]|nr:WecB/TagA/CpsF family glycosyltransferase [Clostridiales bacterium]